MRLNIYTTILLLFFALHCLTSCHNPSPDLTFDQQRDAILAQIAAPEYPAEKVLITVFGAVGDSITDCRPAFDAALQKAKETPGGLRIVVPAGIYLINGPLHLVSGVST